MNKFILILFLFLAGCGANLTTNKFGQKVNGAYHSTCKINTSVGAGSGVLLDTGYILTAAHVVDANGNGTLEYEELDCTAEFFKPGIGKIFSGTVVFMGNYLKDSSQDIAVIALPKDSPRGTISLVSSQTFIDVNYGDEIFTLGCPRGKSPKLFSGLLEYPDEDSNIARGSFSSIMGNSGGGVYTSDGKLIGIIVENFAYFTSSQIMMMVPFPVEGGMAMAMGSGETVQVNYAPNWSQFVDAGQIRTVLEAANLKYVIRPMNRPGPVKIYFAVLFNLILLVVLFKVANDFGKKLFS